MLHSTRVTRAALLIFPIQTNITEQMRPKKLTVAIRDVPVFLESTEDEDNVSDKTL